MIAPGWRAAVWWVALGVICLLLALLALRGYYSASMLIDFANVKLCALHASAAVS